MLVTLDLQEAAIGAQQLRERLVRLEDLEPSDGSDVGQKARPLVDRNDHRDARSNTGHLVVFTKRRGLMHDACALAGGDVIGNENLPRVLGAPDRGVGVVVPYAVVAHALELRANDGAADCGDRLSGVGVAEIFRVGADGVFGEQVFALAFGGTISGTSRPARQHRVLDARPNREREVGW